MSDTNRPDKLKLFISYSRKDMAFAKELVDGLEYDGGFEILIDVEGIHEGEDWQGRLGALIAESDTVVFIVSPHSAASKICQWEVDKAEELSKRILPVQAAPLGDLTPPHQLARLQYVRFDDGRSFMDGLRRLRDALNTDLDWLNEHTRLLNRALEWDRAARQANRLMSGADIAAAKKWLETRPKTAPAPTELHRDYIAASEEAEALRLSDERQRADTLAGLVRGTRIALVAALALALVAGGAGLYAYSLKGQAEELAAKAEEEAERATEAEKEAESALAKIEVLVDELLKDFKVYWPEDAVSPDYRHLAATELGARLAGSEFVVTPQVLEALLTLNAFEPAALDGKLLFALRGARLDENKPHRGVGSLELKDVRPDHDSFRSVFIVYDRKQQTLSAFVGSTVPRAKSVSRGSVAMRTGIGGTWANLLPSGLYPYHVGSYRKKPGELRFGGGPSTDASSILEGAGPATVLRTVDNGAYDTGDRWDKGFPFDNLHASSSDLRFSSFGTLTIRGKHIKDFDYSGDFGDFRRALGLAGAEDDGKRIDLVLVTGLDAAVAGALIAQASDIPLAERLKPFYRLRHGSTGPSVARLQKLLLPGGEPSTAFFDAAMVEKLVAAQREKGLPSDGIYTPELDEKLGQCVLTECSP